MNNIKTLISPSVVGDNDNITIVKQNFDTQEEQAHSKLEELNNSATDRLKTELDKKLFAHIHADHVIRGTSLEGADTIANAKYLISCLDVIDISLEVKNILKIAFNSLVSSKDAQLATKVKNLIPGNSLLVSGGYHDGSRGHAVLYEFCKKIDNTYDIYLYNTGEGINAYHPQIQKENTSFYKAVIKFENVFPEELGLSTQNASDNSYFFQYLANLNNSTNNEKKTIAMLYEKGFGHLARKLVVVKEDHSLFIKGQHSGTCSWRVLQAFVLKTLGDFALYKKYVFELKLLTLVLFFKNCKEGCDLESHMLLEEATTNLLRSAAKLYHADDPSTTILSKEKAVCVQATLQEILEKLPDLKANIRRSQPKQEPIKTKEDSFNSNFYDVRLKPSSLQNSSSLLFFSTIDAVNFLTQINRVINHIDALSNKESKAFQIENFVNALPIPDIDSKKDFWQKIPQKDLKKGLSLIHKMVEVYGDLCLNNSPFFPNQQNTALSLLSFAHQIALRIDQQQLGKLANFGIWNAFLSYANQQRFFICFEPNEQQRREKLNTYFISIGKDKQPLFNFSLLEGIFEETTHNQIRELSLFQHAIDQDSILENKLTEQARELLKEKQRETPFKGSLEMVKQIIFITDNELLQSFDKTQHLTELRNISYIVQQFAGYIQKKKIWLFPPRKYLCTAENWEENQVSYQQSFSWESYTDPAIGFHLLPSKDEMKDLIRSHDSFSQTLSVVVQQTEPKLQLQPENNKSLPYQKQLETTQCEPHLQPQKLIYYFQEHLEELMDLNKQALFDLIFFKQVDRKVSLFQELKSNSFFIKQCKQFIIEGLDRFSQSRSEDPTHFFAYLFFVRLIYRLNQIQQDLQLANLDLPSTQDALNRWLKSSSLSLEHKACLHLHRMMQYAHLLDDKISFQQLHEIIPSWFYYKRSHLLEKHMPYLENQAINFIYRLGPCVEKLMLKEQQAIICQILQVVGIASFQQETIKKISLQPPFYTITLNNKNFWKLNLLTAQIANARGLVESASTKELQKTKNYQDLFKDKIFDIYRADGYYCFFCSEKGQIRIHKWEYINDCEVEAFINGNWYQYVPESTIIKTKLPCALIEDHWHWHSIKLNEMFIISKEHNQIIAKVHIKKSDKSSYHQNQFDLLKIENLQQERILYPTDPLEPPLIAINRIEDPDWRLIYQGEHQTRICFPRLHSLQGEKLEFIFEHAEQKTQFIKNKHFTIAKHIPGLIGYLENYLVLEDVKHKKKKVLIPVQEIKKNKNLSPEGICLNFKSENRKHTYLEFELNNKKLSAMNQEGTLFLAYLYLAQRDYIKAVEHLHQIVKADFLSELASAILTNFFNLSELNQDQHPSAAAIRLKALFLLQSKNNWEIEESIQSRLMQDYITYSSRISNVDSRLLLTFEEREHLSSIFPPRSILSPSDCLQQWEKAESLFLPNFSFKEWYDIDTIIKHACNHKHDISTSIKSILESFKDFQELYEQARSAKTETERLFISTQLHFTADKYKKVTLAIIHFALKEKQLPAFPTSNKEEWLKQVLEKYRKQYNKQKNLHTKLTFRSAAEDQIFHVSDKRIPQRLQGQCLPFSQIQIKQALSLSHVEPENRCFSFSELVNTHFTPMMHTSIENSPLHLEKIEKEDYQQAIEKGYEDFQKDLEEGIFINQASTEFHLEKSGIKDLYGSLKSFLDPKSLEAQKQKILQLANSKPAQYALQNDFLEKGRFKSRVDLRQLVCAFLKGDANDYYQLNFYLSVQEIQELDCLLQKFMLESTKQQQVQRALTLLENMQKTEINDITSISQELYTVLTEEMSYDPAENRILLVYEYQAGIRVRQNQMKLISEMIADPNTGKCRNLIAQLIMGGGKTSVLASILLAIFAKPPKLAVFIPPAAQFDTLRNNLKTTQHAYFLQELIPIALIRSEFSQEKLKEVYRKLKQAQDKGWAVLIQKETLQSFDLELQSTLYKEKEPEKITILRDIVQLFRYSAHALFDECDLQLNPMQEVNFTIGEKKQIDPIYIACGAEIFKILASNQLKTINEKQSLAEFVGLLDNAQSFMKTEDYYNQVLPVLAKELFKSYKNTLLLLEEDEVHFLKYVQGKLESSNLTMQEVQFLTLLKNHASSLDDLEKEAAALIAWIKMQFTEILPLTLSKDTNRHYGRLNTQELGKVVPYQGVNSPATTQFGSPWEALAYQFQTALSKKLDRDLVKAYVQKIYQAAELISFHTQVSIEDTQEAKDFLKLTAVFLSQAKNEESLKKIVENINKDPSKILEVESDFSIRLINYYPSYLNSNASHLFEQFAVVTGFSGTPWNSSCYPGDLAENVLFDLGTEGRIVDIACQKARKNPHAIHLIQNTRVQEILKSCLQKNPRQNQVMAFIDVAGIFKDYDNLYTAEQILVYFKDHSRIEHVLFFGRTNPQESSPNTLMALKKDNPLPIVIGSTHVQELEKHGIDPKSTFIYYDERHSEATDLPQIPDAVNLLSSNGSMILRDLLQGMLRARGYLKKQDIEYVIHENTIKQLGIQDKVTFENAVLNPSIVNQAERKAKETYRAFLHKIDQVLFKCAWEDLLDCKNPNQMIKLFKQYHTLFLHSSEVDCFKQYGDLLQRDFGLQVLEKYAQDRLQQWKRIQPKPLLWEKVEENLTQVIQRAAVCKFLPNLVEVTLSTLGMEQQIEMQQEIEQEVDVEIEKELESYQHKGKIEPRTESVWDFDAIASKCFLKIAKIPSWYTETSSILTKKILACSGKTTAPKTYLLSDFIQSYRHLKPYHKIFEEQKIIITENAMYTSDHLCSIFSNTQKPAHQILIIKDQEGLQAVLLSIQEAKTFKEYLSTQKPSDIWLILPNAEKLSLPEKEESLPNLQQEMPEHADWLARTLWFINFLNGDLFYLANNAELTEKIIKEKDPELKIHFLKLKTSQDSKKKTLFCYLLEKILDDTSRANRVKSQQRRVEQKNVKEFVQRLTEQDIGQLSKEDNRYISHLDPKKVGYLKDPNLIQQLNIPQVKEVMPSQVPYLLPTQVCYLNKKEQIQNVSNDMLNRLSPEQINYLTINQIAFLPNQKMQYLKQELLVQIDPARICLLYKEKNLSNLQLKWLSKIQLVALLEENQEIKEILPHLDNNQLQYIEKEEQIQAVPLDFVSYLVGSQIPFLNFKQINQTTDLQYKHLTTEQFKYKYGKYSTILMLLKGWVLWNLRILAYVCGIYLLKRISFLRFFGNITNVLDCSNIYLGIGYRMLTNQ